jgi:hypothetical protein
MTKRLTYFFVFIFLLHIVTHLFWAPQKKATVAKNNKKPVAEKNPRPGEGC